MKYIDIQAPEQLVFAHCDEPKITPQQCLIKVKAIGVNRADILQKQGKYPPPAGESTILGLEVSGEIVATGDDVTQWQPGQRVYGLVAGGGYAEYAKIDAEHILPLPDNLSFEQGAALAEVMLTAYQSLFSIAALPSEARVLIHAGASGVGTAAIQQAKAHHCHVVVTVGSDEKGNACLALGADAFINYREQDFVAWSKQHQAGGYDVILDVVAGAYVKRNVEICALDGHIVILAMQGGRYSEPLDVAKLLMKRVNLHASTLRNRSDAYKTKLIAGFQQQFGQSINDGSIRPVIDSVYGWHEVANAHARMEANANIGKIVLRIDS